MDEAKKKFMATVKVGEKGQIVIPKEIRQMFDIQSGDSLLLLADQERGIAIMPPAFCRELMRHMMSGLVLDASDREQE